MYVGSYNKYCIWLFRFISSPEGIDNYCRKSINIQNNIEILKIRVFSTPISPRAAGRRRHAHRLRWLPVGGPPLGDFFLQNWSKLMILMLKSSFSNLFNVFSCQNISWNIVIFMKTHFVLILRGKSMKS